MFVSMGASGRDHLGGGAYGRVREDANGRPPDACASSRVASTGSGSYDDLSGALDRQAEANRPRVRRPVRRRLAPSDGHDISAIPHLRGARLVTRAARPGDDVGLLSVIRAARPGSAKLGRRCALVMPRRPTRGRVVLRASRPRVVLRASSGASDRVLLIVSGLPTDVSDMEMRLTAASNGLLRLSAPCPTELVAHSRITRTGASAATTTSRVRC
jgi:hypothetical protein